MVQEKKDLSKEIEQSRAENDKKNAELVGVKKDLKSLETEHRVKQDVFKRISDKWKKAQADKVRVCEYPSQV